MEAQRLHQHKIREMLQHQRFAGLALAQFPHHLSDRPAQRRLPGDMDDRRQQPQQHVGMVAADTKTAADEGECAAAIQPHRAAPLGRRKSLAGLGGRQAQVAAQRKALMRLHLST